MTIEDSAWDFLPSYSKNGDIDNNAIIWRFTQSVTINLLTNNLDQEVYNTAKSFLHSSILVEDGIIVTFIGNTEIELNNHFQHVDVKPGGAIYFRDDE